MQQQASHPRPALPAFVAKRPDTTAFRAPAVHAAAPRAPASPPRGGLSSRALARALEYLHAHLGERFSLQELASAAAVSRFHFARMFRVSIGHSPMEFLVKLRIDAARALLQSGKQRIADIAATLGFCDQSHFTRTFRRATGVAPREYAHRGATRSPARTFGSFAQTAHMPMAANDDTQSSAA